MTIDFEKYHPIVGGGFRVGQKESLESIVKYFDSGNKIIELDAPTSMGKTLCLNIFGNVLIKEYGIKKVVFTSPQVSLITKGILWVPKLVGRVNYRCPSIENCTADDCPFTEKEEGFDTCAECPYRAAKRGFFASDFGATTYPRFEIDPRIRSVSKAVLIDESTNLFDSLVESASLQVPNSFLLSKDVYESLSGYKANLMENLKGVAERCKEERINAKENIYDSALQKNFRRTRAEYRAINRDIDACARAMQYIQIDVPYVIAKDFEERRIRGKKVRIDKVSFKVLDAKEPFRELTKNLDAVVLASGTPTTELHAVHGSYASVIAPHPIDKTRRMIYYKPVGSMSRKNREFTIPSMSYTIGELHSMYNTKTIVHCGSYEIAGALHKRLSGFNTICQDSDNRVGSLESWTKEKDCIFLSVAMEQGLDLKGPEYTVNIIAKVNFPYLGDEWVKERNNLDKWYWYNKIAEVNVVQACGRTTRAPDDYSEIYITDSDFQGLYNRNKKLFPEWFKESLIM